jgi:hypothetical protein
VSLSLRGLESYPTGLICQVPYRTLILNDSAAQRGRFVFIHVFDWLLLMRAYCPLANGIRTDHPVPDLPFVDDSHIPLDELMAVQTMGRDIDGVWDAERNPRGWVTYTTDPIRRDLAWCVRYHPEHGRSVLLHHEKDAESARSEGWGSALLFRHDGYWWDGSNWYRPASNTDPISGAHVRQAVEGAVTITVADLLGDAADPTSGRLQKIVDFSPVSSTAAHWLDDLAMWAVLRTNCQDALPPSRCVVRLSAPELSDEQGEADHGKDPFSTRRGVSPVESARPDLSNPGRRERNNCSAQTRIDATALEPDLAGLATAVEPISRAALIDALSSTDCRGVLDRFTECDPHGGDEHGDGTGQTTGIMKDLAEVLEWLVRHHPGQTIHLMSDMPYVAQSQAWGAPDR